MDNSTWDNSTCGGESDAICPQQSRIFLARPEDILDPSSLNPAFLAIVTTHTIVFLLGTVGNTLVIATWAGSKPNRSPTCTFLVSLAVADLLVLVFFVPLETLQYFVVTWDADGTVCKLSSYVEMISGMASVLNLTAVSIERFLVIAYPIMARRFCTLSTCRRGLLVVWVLAICLALPASLTKEVFPMTYYNNVTSITAYYCFDSTNTVAVQIAYYELIAMFVLPAIFMTCCYICVIRELWSSTRTVAAMTRPNETETEGGNCTNSNHCLVRFTCGRQQRTPRGRVLSIHKQGLEIQQARKQVIKMLIIVIVLFMGCWGPRLVMNVFIKYGLDTFDSFAYNLRVATYLLSFSHSAINPVIYGFMSTNFRRMMLQCCKDGVCGKMSCSRCAAAKKSERLEQRRNQSDSYEFSTLTTSTRRSKQANSINVEDSRLKKSEEQWTAV